MRLLLSPQGSKWTFRDEFASRLINAATLKNVFGRIRKFYIWCKEYLIKIIVFTVIAGWSEAAKTLVEVIRPKVQKAVIIQLPTVTIMSISMKCRRRILTSVTTKTRKVLVKMKNSTWATMSKISFLLVKATLTSRPRWIFLAIWGCSFMLPRNQSTPFFNKF